MATCFGDGNPGLPFRYGEKEMVEQQTGRTFKLGKFLSRFLCLSCFAGSRLRSPVAGHCSQVSWYGTCAGERTNVVLFGSYRCRTANERWSGLSLRYRRISRFGLLLLPDRRGAVERTARICPWKRHEEALRHIVSIYKGRNDAEIEKVYGLERQVVCCGPAGSGFAEDIFGFS